MLTPGEVRGQTLKRYVRAAAALNGIYDDTAIAEALGVNRGAVGAWWTGSRMSTDTIRPCYPSEKELDGPLNAEVIQG